MISKMLWICAFFWKGIIFAFIQFPKESMSQKWSTFTNQKTVLDLFLELALGPIPEEVDSGSRDGNQEFLSPQIILTESKIWD